MGKVLGRKKRNSEEKKKIDGNLQIYNKKVNNVILKFARAQENNKYHFCQINGIKNQLHMIKLSSYKLVQFLNTYVCPKEIKTPIEICSRIARKWLGKLQYEYKNVGKDVFKYRY